MAEPRRADAPLDPRAVAERLEALRRLWVALDADEARRLMTPSPTAEPFAVAVARRLEELRALDALTRHLHSPRRRH
ncbi:MAG: hypothetical protein IT385_08555 [Deltaproteobacteria bacterium]|nr:hypothetical protein [Deltaproteobacteria bacterium]